MPVLVVDPKESFFCDCERENEGGRGGVDGAKGGREGGRERGERGKRQALSRLQDCVSVSEYWL